MDLRAEPQATLRCSANLFEAVRREFTDNQLALFVEEPHLVSVGNQVRRGPAGFRHQVETLPDAVARVCTKASEHSVAVDAVDVIAQPEGC